MKKFTTTLCLILVCTLCRATLPTGDDFDSPTENTTNWAPDEVAGHGVLSLVDQQLQYRVNGAPTESDQSIRPWIASLGPYTSDWEVQIDTLNTAVASATNQQIACGITIDGEASDFTNEILAVQLSGASAPSTPEVGFTGRIGTATNGVFVSAAVTSTNGAVRITFNSTTKVFTLFYDADHSGGYSWTQLGSFGINGSGGADANQSWGLTNSSQLAIRVYGFSTGVAVSSNEVSLDNFSTTGLVAPVLPHDLAVTSIKVPKSVNLTTKKPSVTSKAVVTIQNLGPLNETITADNITNLVDFELTSLAPATCPPPVPVLVMPKVLPITLTPKKSLKLNYTITFDCANNPGKGTATTSAIPRQTVNTDAINGETDTTPGNNVCPRDPSGTDKGCGNKNPDGTLGGDIFTDVIMKTSPHWKREYSVLIMGRRLPPNSFRGSVVVRV